MNVKRSLEGKESACDHRRIARPGPALALEFAQGPALGDQLTPFQPERPGPKQKPPSRNSALKPSASWRTFRCEVDLERLAGEALARFGGWTCWSTTPPPWAPPPCPTCWITRSKISRRSLHTNLVGPFQLTSALVGQMLAARSGSIINVSSDAGVVGYATWGAYGVSKAALDQLPAPGRPNWTARACASTAWTPAIWTRP